MGRGRRYFREAATPSTAGIMMLPRQPADLGEVVVGVPLLAEIGSCINVRSNGRI